MHSDPAAALLKEQLKGKSKLQVRTDKQIDTAHKSFDKLKDVGYPRFLTQLSRFGDFEGWDKEIYDVTVPALTAAEIVLCVRHSVGYSQPYCLTGHYFSLACLYISHSSESCL